MKKDLSPKPWDAVLGGKHDSVLDIISSSTESIHISKSSIPFNGTVARYKPAGTARGNFEYFRYYYYEEDRKKHKHIKGGNTSCQLAISNAQLVRDAIATGKSPSEILKLIDTL